MYTFLCLCVGACVWVCRYIGMCLVICLHACTPGLQLCTPSLHVCVHIFTYMYACTYPHRVFVCDFWHDYIRWSSPRGGVVSKCHPWPCHERDLTRTFVGGQFSKAHELSANEHVGFFALLSSGHAPLLGYKLHMTLACFVSKKHRWW